MVNTIASVKGKYSVSVKATLATGSIPSFNTGCKFLKSINPELNN
jgi:hypothetical protein